MGNTVTTEQNKATITAKYEMMEKLIQEKKKEEGKIVAEEIRKELEDNKEEHMEDYYEEIGNIYKNNGYEKEAKRAYEKIIGIGERKKRTEKRERKEENDENRKIAEAILKRGNIKLGDLNYQMKEFEKALTHYERGNYKNHFRIGCIHYELGAYEKAISEYAKIEGIEKRVEVLNNMGVAYESLGIYDKAIQYYNKALTENPEYALALFNLASVKHKQAAEETIALHQQEKSNRQTTLTTEQEAQLYQKLKLGIVTHQEYAILAEEVYYKKRPLPKYWNKLLTADEIKFDCEGFYAVAYINHISKAIVIAIRGTDDKFGIKSDIWLSFDAMNIQFALATYFVKHVNKLLLTIECDDYRLSYTGHSLGGTIASYLAYEHQAAAVTFDTPGAAKIIEAIERKKRHLRPTEPFELPYVNTITYLTAPNLVNTWKPHVGTRIRIFPNVISTQNDTTSTLQKIMDINHHTTKKLTAKRTTAVPFYVRWVAPTNVTNGIDMIYRELDDMIQHTAQQHTMETIMKTLLARVVQMEEITSWPNSPFACYTFTKAYPKLERLRSLETLDDAEQALVDVYTHTITNLAGYETRPITNPNCIPLTLFPPSIRDLLVSLSNMDPEKRTSTLPALFSNLKVYLTQDHVEFKHPELQLGGFEFQQLLMNHQSLMQQSFIPPPLQSKL